MISNPYKFQPNTAFWSRSVRNESFLDPVTRASFKIGRDDKVATAGSCFAQHISSFLRSIGINPYVTESVHPVFASGQTLFQYGLYSARYGNIYSSRQLVQLIERAFGLLSLDEPPWEKDGRLYDPFRPGIPGGYISEEELNIDRAQHLRAVREMFEGLDVFIFTLGLTEIWVSNTTGSVFPSCPGVIAGRYDEKAVSFVNLTVNDVVSDMGSFINILRRYNSKAKILITVSPVPLVATATKNHVLSATIYSKSTLRAAAEMISDAFPDVDYFPSYEIITSPSTAGKYYAEDLRTVRPEGVKHVMDIFKRHYLDDGIIERSAVSTADEEVKRELKDAFRDMGVVCEEAYNDSISD